MASTLYEYEKAADVERLESEINASAIITALDYINFTTPTDLKIYFKAELSSGDEDILDALVAAHENISLVHPELVELAEEKDVDNVPYFRQKISLKGSRYRLQVLDFKTSDLDSLYEKKADGTNFGYSTIKLFDAQDNEITEEANEGNCVKTQIDFEPPFGYEIVGGKFVQDDPSVATETIRVWAIGCPDIPEEYGGSIYFATGIPISMCGYPHACHMDGRVPKYMPYTEGQHTNKMRFIIKHEAGLQHHIAAILEIFVPG